MSDQLLPDGTYTVMGPGGQISMGGDFPGVTLLPPSGDQAQQWKAAFDSGTYTLRSVAPDLYLGNDGDPDNPSMMITGTETPFAWKLSTGDDDNEETYVLTSAASNDGLVLSISLLRIYPPQLAILDPGAFRTVEWTFNPV